MLSDSQVQKYLDKIGFDGNPHADRHTLDELIFRHQCSIPFQTVTLHRLGVVPSLELDDIYDKVINRSLGGYCFELNKLFEALLSTLGFDVRPCLCRSARGRAKRMPINHRGEMVFLGEGAFFADIGFGGPMPAGALALADSLEQDVRGDAYIPRFTGDTWWDIDRMTKASADLFDDNLPKRRQTELSLCAAPVYDEDFCALNLSCAQPGTPFRDHELANLRTPDGHCSLKDMVLTKHTGGEKQVVELESAEEVDKALENLFGMEGL